MVKDMSWRKQELDRELCSVISSLLVEDEEGFRGLTVEDVSDILFHYPTYAVHAPDGDSLGLYVCVNVNVKNYDFKIVSLYDYVIDVYFNDILRDEMNEFRHLSSDVESGMWSERQAASENYMKELSVFFDEFEETEFWKMLQTI